MNAVKIEFDEDAFAAQVKEEVQRLVPHLLPTQDTLTPLTISIKQMSELTGLSQSALRENVLIDPRIQQHEVHFMQAKRLWEYEGFKRTYLELAKKGSFTKL